MSWIDRIAKHLDLPPREKAEALQELANHFDQLRQRSIAAGKTIEDAEQEAARTLGSPEIVAAVLQSSHMQAGWRTTALAAAPFLLLALVAVMKPYADGTVKAMELPALQWLSIGAAVAIVLTGTTLWIVAALELRRDRPAPWLATWLAVGIVAPLLVTVHGPALARALRMQYAALAGPLGLLALTYALLSSTAATALISGTRSRVSTTSVIAAVIALSCTAVQYGYDYRLWNCRYYVIRYHATGPLMALFIICALVSLSLTGWKAFAGRVYGNHINWSLFTLGCLASIGIVVGYSRWAYDDISRSVLVLAAGILAVMTSVVAFARSCHSQSKQFALLLGAVVCSVFGAIGGVHEGDSAAFWSAVGWLTVAQIGLVLALPTGYHLWRCRRQAILSD